MKNLIILAVITALFSSCKKDDGIGDIKKGGTIDNEKIQEDEKELSLSGTTWVLTKFVKGMATEYPNDTIVFGENTSYTLNGMKSSEYRYVLTKLMDMGNPYNLKLYGFSPFGDNGLWQATLTNTFISEGYISLTEFTNSNTSKTKVRANFKKIK